MDVPCRRRPKKSGVVSPLWKHGEPRWSPAFRAARVVLVQLSGVPVQALVLQRVETVTDYVGYTT